MNVKIPPEALGALVDGHPIEITHPNLGRDGYNGSITIEVSDEGYTAEWQKR